MGGKEEEELVFLMFSVAMEIWRRKKLGCALLKKSGEENLRDGYVFLYPGFKLRFYLLLGSVVEILLVESGCMMLGL